MSGRGRCVFGGVEFAWFRRRSASPRPRPRAGQELFDASLVGSNIQLRHWQPGDRFQPIGMSAPVKLQDLFTNAKIPALRRRQLVVAASAGGEIFWVEGLRIAERFKLGPGTRFQLRWTWRRKL